MSIFRGMIVLCEQPLTIACREDWVNLVVKGIERNPKIKHCHIFAFPFWNRAGIRRVAKEYWRIFNLAHSRTRVHMLLLSSHEVSYYQKFGLRREFSHLTIWLNDHLFKIDWIPLADRPFDAIYVAAMAAYKRPWLARDIERLRIITRTQEFSAKQQSDWGILHASINDHRIARSDLLAEYSKACVALALSNEEGNMVASTEALLCGLPLVTTKSVGGRAEYYTEHNHIVVEDTAAAIKSAVEHFKNTWHIEIAQAVRTETFRKLSEFRADFTTYVNQVLDFHCLKEDFFALNSVNSNRIYVDKDHFLELIKSYDGVSFSQRQFLQGSWLH